MKRALALFFGCAFLLVAQSAWADGVLIAPTALSQKNRERLERRIASARAAHPDAFAAVAALRAELPQLDAYKRGRLPSITPALKALGPDALMAMLEEIAVDADPRGDLTDTAWLGWRVALLEAVGSLRDPRSAPVLVAVLAGPESDFLVLKSAAAALAKEGTDRVVKKLLDLVAKPNDRRLAVLAGMGHCRRTAVAERLGQALAEAATAHEANVVAHSLGDVGSAWAWETPGVAASGDGDATRSTAAQALVDGFVAFDDAAVRKTITQAVLVVDWHETPAMIAAARGGADPGTQAALDDLAQSFADSPFH
jgi:hypothetical protein